MAWFVTMLGTLATAAFFIALDDDDQLCGSLPLTGRPLERD